MVASTDGPEHRGRRCKSPRLHQTDWYLRESPRASTTRASGSRVQARSELDQLPLCRLSKQVSRGSRGAHPLQALNVGYRGLVVDEASNEKSKLLMHCSAHC